MQVYQTDQDGFLVAAIMADPDPMVEGNWLIPGGCITIAPPPIGAGERAQWIGTAWVIIPDPQPEPEPEPTPEEIAAAAKEAFRQAVQAHVDVTAQSRMYENGMSLAGYVSSAVPQWQAEAQAFVAWRDSVWLFVFGLLAQIEANEAEPPESPAALVALLPAMEWPA